MARFSQGLFNALSNPSYGEGLMTVGAQLGSAQATAQAAERQKEIDEDNLRKGVDEGELANGRHMTNIGIFRKYADLYIASHPMINENMTRMVRQLQQTGEGLPLEVYCFSKDKRWTYYEGIKGDIFDHLYAVAKKFDLEIFQEPSGTDFENAFSNKN